jgi:uncharacterized membrane protein YgdD (TMEM256/DUF423 family)
MNTEQLILLISLIALILSGLAIGFGFFSVYQLKKNYPDYQINWYKNIVLWIMWTLICIFSFGLLQHKNWGRIGFIFGLSLLFATITITIAIRLIGYVILILNDSQSNQEFEQDTQEIEDEYLEENNYQFYAEDLDELNYNEAIFQGGKDLDELNLYDDEGDDDEIYYLDNLSEDEENFNDNSERYSFQFSLKNYARQGLIVTTIMAFIVDLLIFALISFLKNPEVELILSK